MNLKNIGLSVLGLYLINSNKDKGRGNKTRNFSYPQLDLDDIKTINLESIEVIRLIKAESESEYAILVEYQNQIKSFVDNIKDSYEVRYEVEDKLKGDESPTNIAKEIYNGYELSIVIESVLDSSFLNKDVLNDTTSVITQIKKLLKDDIQEINYASDLSVSYSLKNLKILEAVYTLKLVVLAILFGENPLTNDFNKNRARFEFTNVILHEMANYI